MPKDQKKPRSGPAVTTLGRETEFYGKLTFTESLRIEGKFEGVIEATGDLFVDKGAEVKAEVARVASAIVEGTLRGRIEAADKVDMLSAAKVYGDVLTAKLRIADGAIFEGRCEMIRNSGAWSPFPPPKTGV